ncbi:hypothetical protein PAESOLCIP111_01065 [Paenibacillus solanacearum]|uniref:Extracellular solute-binding protein n=1 Tax=Paenibacillus solanacearum TaxID=2048548 RepID=A0A916NVK5_9BACL|nr:ABC transporter substrate-binding protein [Paenibacillus solanacearum]CAG7608455.1 hypothetical protein PAESOLCIP111_01065 [Paenibacillus solanacearum]
MIFDKRAVVVMLALAAPMSLLSACSGANSAGQGGAETNATVSAKTDEPAELVVFGNPGDPENVFDVRIGDAVRKKFPNYKITYIRKTKDVTMETLITSGSQVDLIYDSVAGAVSSVVNTGSQFDISDLAKKHRIDFNRFDPGQLDAVKSLGGLYGLPIQTGGLVMYYNKDIFDKFGIAYPGNGMTWEEAIELGKKLTRKQDGVQYIGLGLSPHHAILMNSLSAPFVDKTTEKAAVNNETFKNLLDTLVIKPTLVDGYKDAVTAIKSTINNNTFMKDRTVAMFIMNYGLQDQDYFKEFNWDMAPLPVFKEKPGIGSQPYPAVLCLSSSSKYKDQAMEMLKYLTSDEYQLDLSKRGFVPVLKDEKIKKAFAQDLGSYKNKNVVNALFFNQTAPSAPKTQYDAMVTNALIKQYLPLITGNTDVNTALRTAEEEANKSIQDAKNNKK